MLVVALGVGCWFASGGPCAAADEYRLAVFELDSDELHDQFADVVASRLRTTLDARADYALHDTRVSLAQLSLAQNCNTIEVTCLSAIARSLGVDGFLFGKVTHDGGSPVVVVRRFDLWSETVVRSALGSFATVAPQNAELDDVSAELLDDLLGPEPDRAKVAGAELAPPVEPPALERPNVIEREDSGISPHRIAGFALLGGAVLSTGLSVLSFYEVGRAERNRDYERYRLAVGQRNMSIKDVCDEAEAGRRYGLDAASFREAKNACNRGVTFEILQFVFIGSAVVSGGLAAYFLTSGTGKRERPSLGTKDFSLHPTFARSGFGLTSRLKF